METSEQVDVLILHGRSKHLVNFLCDIFRSLGLSAQSILELPSRHLPQDEKVDYYITNCRLPIVLVTFDEEEPGTSKARPNVYDEIQRCRRLKGEDVILLQEGSDGKHVELPSNILGRMVTIPFSQAALHALVPTLLRELLDRHLLDSPSASSQVFESGDIMSEFLDTMNDIWDHQFDPAWDSIFSVDSEAERKLSILLDQFFQQYLKVITALVKGQEKGRNLRATCEGSIREARLLCAKAWELAADVRMHKAEEEYNQLSRLEKSKTPRSLLELADKERRRGERTRDTEEKITHLRKAVNHAGEFLNTMRDK